MDIVDNPMEIMSMASMILLLLLSAHRNLQLSTTVDVEDESCDDLGFQLLDSVPSAEAMDSITQAALHQLRLWISFVAVDEDLGYWVKPRSTTWFSRFLIQEYDDERWVGMFRMSKRAVFSLAELLKPTIQKKDTKYRVAILVIVCLACSLFKLSHGASLLVCSELFAVGKSTVSMMLREVVHAVNVVLRSEISWPIGDRLHEIATEFQQVSGLPSVVGAIDETQISISKPKFGAPNYYYFKSGGYSMNCQAVVDSSKRFLDLHVGMSGSTNDSRMLRRSVLYRQAQQHVLWDSFATFNGFSPYLVGDSGYPLLPWLMVPHRRHRQLALADRLFNKKLSRARCVVENAFALLKQSFKELHVKSELDVTFLPDVVVCCGILHNILLKQSHAEVERLLEVLQTETAVADMEVDQVVCEPVVHTTDEQQGAAQAMLKRREFGVYLAVQRNVPV